MFRRKSDVDKHVKDLLRKVKNEHERNLRCYHIASMYYKAQDFDSAKKYVTMYLSVRDDSSLAHKLLGQCYEGLNLKDKALGAYRRSLELEANQAELILKICELFCDKDVEFDPVMARYWADRASSLFPHDPSVFMLKEKLLSSDDSIASNDLENLLNSELKARPSDIAVRIKLLNLYVDSGRTELALNHVTDIEKRQSHNTNLPWYQCVSHICEVYHKENSSKCDWEFYVQWLSAIDRVCSLSLSEVLQGGELTESIETVYNLDQIIFQANSNIANPSEIFKEFIKHIGSQLMFHITMLLLKRAKKQGNGLWKETKKMIVPLLLIATFDSPKHALHNNTMTESNKKMYKIWYNHSRCRIVQAGQMLLSLVKEAHSEKLFLEKVFHFTVNNWKLLIFQKVFSSLDQLNLSSSYFLTSNSNIPKKIPSQNNFKPSTFVSSFESVYVGSLHHLVWLGIQSLQNTNSIVRCKLAPSFHTTQFKNLQFTGTNLNSISVESLNQLDIDSFLYAAVFCAGVTLEDQKVGGYLPPDRPPIIPADVSVPLCTAEQSKWWTGACCFSKSVGDSLSQAKNSMADLRHLLQRGLEIVRGENIPLPLLINIARTFSLRAAECEKMDEAEGCEARALHLWQIAIPQLERIAAGSSLNKHQKTNLIFDFPIKDLEMFDVNGLLEEARYFVGCHLMKSEKYEEAIDNFKSLNTAQAAFNQALIYQKLAEQQINGYRGEEVTSEMRCNQAVMASKARDSLFRAKDMIKDNHSHPFHHKIKDKLIEVDELLSRIEPENATLFSLGIGEKDICNNTDGNLSNESGGSPVLIAGNSRLNHSHRFHQTSTPNRHYDLKFRNNSAEIVDILTMQQNTNQLKMQQILEHVKLILEKIESLTFEQRSQTSAIEDLSNKVVSLENDTRNVLSDIKKEVKRPDLYNMIEEDEYPDEMLQYQNYPAYYPPQRNIQGTGAVAYGGPAVPQYFSPRVDQMYQGNVGFYNQGALPFSDGQQLPDFLRTMQPKLPPSLATPQGIASLQSSLGLSAAAAAGTASQIVGLNAVNRLSAPTFNTASALSAETNRAPTNVVITTSDTLPTGVPSVQPTLSVTIPPQHRLGDISSSTNATSTSAVTASTVAGIPFSSASVAHQFQIHLPLQAEPQKTTSVESDDEIPLNESSNQEFDSTPDFKPIIPLPKEVAVVTGEEQEDVVFIGKAKLLRFADKIWKERGTGDLKILKDKTNNKARILMRREKIHKICANHFLTSDMELIPMQPKGLAWCWTASDFADEVTHIEKLCAKFKTAEEGQKFKEIFDQVKSGLVISPVKEMSDVSISTGQISFPTKPSSTSNVTSAASIFSIPPAVTFAWKGTSETISSNSIANKITAGGFTFTSPPKLPPAEEAKVVTTVEAKKAESPFAGFSFSSNQNTSKLNVSNKEQHNSPESTKNTSSGSFFSILNNSNTSTTSGTSSPFQQSQNSFLSSGNFKPFSENYSFTFHGAGTKVFGDEDSKLSKSLEGTDQTSKLSFQVAGSKIFGDSNSAAEISNVKEIESPHPHADDEFIPTATFEPVVPLPELVQVVSGEEGEMVLFEERAKLYRFCKDTKQWKERGVGKMKILKNEETGVVRLVMRREQVFKVCCNHRLTSDIVLSPSTTSDRSYSWGAKDFSEGADGVNEIFTLKLKSPGQALAFKEAFEKAQANLIDTSPSKSKEHLNSELPTLKANYIEGSWDCSTCYVHNNPQTVNCVACGSNKPGFTPAATKESTTGSFSNSVSFGFTQTTVVTTASTINQAKPSISSLHFRPPGAWNCSACYVENKEEDSVCISCKTNKTNTKPSTNSVFSNSFTKFDNSSSFGGTLQPITFGEPQSIACAQKTGSFGTSGFTFAFAPKDTSAEDTLIGPNQVFNFGVDTALQDVQTSKSKFNFSLNKIATQAQPIITSPEKQESGSEHGDSDQDGKDESDIYFKPVIPLPDKINVVTGEEDETVLYSHRAKLFRFDATSKEWKERGIGDIKILKHNATGKIRLLMRREPIFKLSLNHYLTPDIVMKVKEDKSWIWSAKDFASGEVVQEQFAIRFKTPQIAQEFKEAVDEAKSQLVDDSSLPQIESMPSDDNDDVEIVYEQKVSEELRKKAESLMLPPNFYLYLQANPCPGCPGCDKDEDDETLSLKSVPSKTSTAEPKKTTKIILKQSILSGIKSITPVKFDNTSKNPSSEKSDGANSGTTVKTDGPSSDVKTSQNTPIFGGSAFGVGDTPKAQPASFGGKENVIPTGQGFFTQQSFISSTPLPITIFGDSTTETKTSQPSSILGGNTFSGAKSNEKFIFGGNANTGDSSKPSQTSFFSGNVGDSAKLTLTSIFGGNANAGDYSKLTYPLFGDSSQLEVKPAQQPIFGGIPSSESLTKPTQKLLFGAGTAAAGDSSANNPSSIFATGLAVDKVKETALKDTTSETENQNLSKPLFGNKEFATFGFANSSSILRGTAAAGDSSANDAPSSFTGGLATEKVKGKMSKDVVSSETENKNLQKPFFGKENATFASLGNSISTFAPIQSNTTSEGAGSLVFGGSKVTSDIKKAHDTSEGSEDGGNDESEHDPHFEPIVALPDLIDVKTGEEDELVLFKERAKLYRYDSQTKEWKERGVGQMKILKHKENNVYRLLMRREIVHKVVCNQRITKDLKMKPMLASEQAFCWLGMNMAQEYEKPIMEKLSVRFKNKDIATSFNKLIDESLKEIQA
ncbi:nucleoporin 358 isoform X3 [Rhodnius prolixus]|uniref:nucleoporin 358 isoform X3 n=1 Tax=Rhodnius prolixus TaxID=13249 RepID=UPI003D188953